MEIKIVKPDDMHLHLRQGEILQQVLPFTNEQFKRAIIMPNTLPPVTSAEHLAEYRKEINKICPDFEPLMTFKVMADMNASDIKHLAEAGAAAGKLYPKGSTTNAEDGPSGIEALYPVFGEMEKQNLVLSIHAEEPSVSVLNREQVFLPKIAEIYKTFPKLKIVVEHVSSAEAVSFVKGSSENVAATITLHHLLFTIDDLIGDCLQPNLFCKPVVKTEEDRKALLDVVFSGHKKFFFGSDSAPHSKDKKEHHGAAGIFSAPVLLPLLTELFEENSLLDKLENFVSRFGADFYNLSVNNEFIILSKEEHTVPETAGLDIIPLFAGRTLKWTVKSV